MSPPQEKAAIKTSFKEKMHNLRGKSKQEGEITPVTKETDTSEGVTRRSN